MLLLVDTGNDGRENNGKHTSGANTHRIAAGSASRSGTVSSIAPVVVTVTATTSGLQTNCSMADLAAIGTLFKGSS